MNCRDVKKLLSDYIDGSLDKNLKMSLQEHLKTCNGCAGELIELKKYFNDMRSLTGVSAPDNFLAKVHERIESGGRFKKQMRALFTPVQIKIPLGAIGAAVAAVAVVFILRSFPFQTAEQVAMVPKLSESALEEQKPKERPPEQDRPSETLGLEAEDMDETDVSETRVKSAQPVEEEGSGAAAAEAVVKPVEPELKKETGGAALKSETSLTETAPEKYFDEIIEIAQEEIADSSVAEDTSGAGLKPGKPIEDDGPVEVALLIKLPDAFEPDVSAMARKKTTDAGFEEKSIQENELTAGTVGTGPEKRAEESLAPPTLGNVLSAVEDLTREMGGDIISVEYITDTSRPRLITVNIPAENYTLFLAGLNLVGKPREEPPSTAAQEKEFVSLEIEFITLY